MQTSLASRMHVWQDGGPARVRQKMTQQQQAILPRTEAVRKTESQGVGMWSRYHILQ